MTNSSINQNSVQNNLPNNSDSSDGSESPIKNSSQNVETSQNSSSTKKEPVSALSKQDVVLSSHGHIYSKQQIRDIQDAIERGLSCYKSKSEIFAVLKNVDHNIVNLVWQKLEQNNPRFFTAYLIRLAVIKQVRVFKELLADQNKLKNSLAKQNNSISTTIPSNTISASSISTNPISSNSISISNPSIGLSLSPHNSGGIVPPVSNASTHSNQLLTNPMNPMNLSLFNTGLMAQSFDQGRHNSSISTGSQQSMLPQNVNNNRFTSPVLQLNNTYMQMPSINFPANQQFSGMNYQGANLGYQNSNFGTFNSILGQGTNDQQFNSYQTFNNFSLQQNQNMGQSPGNNLNFSMGQNQGQKSNSSNRNTDNLLDDVFRIS